MKIATFNINNVNRRLPNLLQWLEFAQPDVVCLQGQKTCNGVAILSRRGAPIVTRMELPGDPGDQQARYIEADGVLIGCIYLPNGNPQPGPKFDYKLSWFNRLHSHARNLLREKIPIVLAGDYNVAPTAMDIYPTKSWDDDALVQPESREAKITLMRPFRR